MVKFMVTGRFHGSPPCVHALKWYGRRFLISYMPADDRQQKNKKDAYLLELVRRCRIFVKPTDTITASAILSTLCMSSILAFALLFFL